MSEARPHQDFSGGLEAETFGAILKSSVETYSEYFPESVSKSERTQDYGYGSDPESLKMIKGKQTTSKQFAEAEKQWKQISEVIELVFID